MRRAGVAEPQRGSRARAWASTQSRPALLLLLLVSPALAQIRDVSLETLGVAMEGRLGVYARNTSTGDEIAVNADKEFPIWDESAGARPQLPELIASAADSRPFAASPRRQALRIQSTSFRTALGPLLVERGDRLLLAGGLSPTIEVGGFSGKLSKSPWIAGYAAAPAGDMVFAVMATDLASQYTAKTLFPDVVEACFRRLVPGFIEKLPETKAEGLLLVSLHEKTQDPKMFPRFPDASVAELRRGSQRLKFTLGQIGRLAVLGRPPKATVVTVQWWSPSDRPASCTSQAIDAGKAGDLLFDLPLDKTGAWRVRVAFGDAIVFDEKFYVTGR